MDAECFVVDGFEATDDSSIEWLDVGCQIKLKKFNEYISWIVSNAMPCEVVDRKQNVAVLTSHLNIKVFHPSDQNSSNCQHLSS